MRDEFSYTFRRYSIVLTLEPGRDWYIRVTAQSGRYAYDGYWRDSAGKSLKDALHEAKVGAMLIRATPTQPTKEGESR